jgi:hypothetical protein
MVDVILPELMTTGSYFDPLDGKRGLSYPVPLVELFSERPPPSI